MPEDRAPAVGGRDRHTRDWNPIGEVWLNPPKESAADDHKLSRAA